MRRWVNALAVLLLAAGVCILLYPAVSDRIATRNHSRAIVDYAVTVDQLTEREIAGHLARARAYNASLTGVVTGDTFSVAGESGSDEYLSILNVEGMIGYVGIPSIDVYLPVYHTVSDAVLRRGVGHLPASAFPVGEAGDHAVLTAHRGLPSAKLFTDLNRLEEGDVFYLYVLDRTLGYRVDRIVVVEPHETEALQPLPGEDAVTLVTCTPYAINSHRLLVRGTALSEESLPRQPVADLLEQKLSRDVWRIALVCLGIALAATLAAILRKRRRRRAGRG